MTKRTSRDWHGCPIRYGATVLGDPWKLLLLRDLAFKNRRRYGDFLNAGEGISTNILAARLGELEAEGVLAREPGPERTDRPDYVLTDKGLALIPTLLALIEWSAAWDRDTEVPAAFLDDYRRDRAGFAERTARQLRDGRHRAEPGEWVAPVA